jgi:hypothetical protein
MQNARRLRSTSMPTIAKSCRCNRIECNQVPDEKLAVVHCGNLYVYFCLPLHNGDRTAVTCCGVSRGSVRLDNSSSVSSSDARRQHLPAPRPTSRGLAKSSPDASHDASEDGLARQRVYETSPPLMRWLPPEHVTAEHGAWSSLIRMHWNERQR